MLEPEPQQKKKQQLPRGGYTAVRIGKIGA